MPVRTNPAVLIVVNDRELLDELSHCLIELDYAVTPAQHPRHALEAASFRQFDAALVGYEQPELNGIELTHKLKRLLGELPVILFTDGSPLSVQSESLASGAFCCLPTHCALDEVEATIEQALGAKSILTDERVPT